jgi:hypothetical protein
MEEGIIEFFSLFNGTAFSLQTEQDTAQIGRVADRQGALPIIVDNTGQYFFRSFVCRGKRYP